MSSNENADPLAPTDLASKVLVSDPAILGVIAFDDEGNSVAIAMKEQMPEKRDLSEEIVGKGAQVLAIIHGAISQYETLFGRFQSFVMDFERSKVVILRAPEVKIVFGLRLARSADVGYITTTVLTLLGVLRRVELNAREAGKESWPKSVASQGDVSSSSLDTARTME